MITIAVNRKRGRPPTGRTLVGVRMLPDEIELLDLWIAANEPGMGRPEAMRRILRQVSKHTQE